jgi:hypothetical protein
LSSFSSLVATFRNRNYAIYTAGNWMSLLGFWMQRLAVSWLTWELSHSEFWVGAVAFAEIVPLLVLPLMHVALVVVIGTLGMMERDGVAVVTAYGILCATLFYFAAFAGAAIELFEKLRLWISG